MNSSAPVSLFNEPAKTIHDYLKIKLTEKTPYISVHKQKIKVISLPLKEVVSEEKANYQFALFNIVIEALESKVKLISFQVLKCYAETVNNQGSSESSFSDEVFSIYLKKFQDEINKKRVEEESKIILAKAQATIFSITNLSIPLEEFHRAALANALRCHRRLYIDRQISILSPRPSMKCLNIPQKNFNKISDEESRIIKKLSTAALDTLIKFWIDSSREYLIKKLKPSLLILGAKTSDSGTKEISLETLSEIITMQEQEDVKPIIIDKPKQEFNFDSLQSEEQIISYFQRLETGLISDILEEATCREFSLISMDVLGKDITRQIRYVTVRDSKKFLFTYQLGKKQKKAKASTLFSSDLENFKKFLKTFVNYFTRNETSARTEWFGNLYITKLDKLAENAIKDTEGFSNLCEEFIRWLKDSDKGEDGVINKKLYYTLLTMSQKSYSLASLVITQVLNDLQWQQRENSRSLEFQLSKAKITLISSMMATKTMYSDGEAPQDIKLCISNTVISPINSLSTPSCEIYIKVYPCKDHALGIREKIIEPLSRIGFRVLLLDLP